MVSTCQRAKSILVNGMSLQIASKDMVCKSGQMVPNSKDFGTKTKLSDGVASF